MKYNIEAIDAFASDMEIKHEPYSCRICKYSIENPQQHYEICGICSRCANTIANFYWYAHSGNWLTYDNPEFQEPQPSRGHISNDLRFRVYKKNGFKCVQCGCDENLCIDHIKPFSKGGECVEENFQTLCRTCNYRKKAKYDEADGGGS